MLKNIFLKRLLKMVINVLIFVFLCILIYIFYIFFSYDTSKREGVDEYHIVYFNGCSAPPPLSAVNPQYFGKIVVNNETKNVELVTIGDVSYRCGTKVELPIFSEERFQKFIQKGVKLNYNNKYDKAEIGTERFAQNLKRYISNPYMMIIDSNVGEKYFENSQVKSNGYELRDAIVFYNPTYTKKISYNLFLFYEFLGFYHDHYLRKFSDTITYYSGKIKNKQ